MNIEKIDNDKFYAHWKPLAQRCKIFLQMIIGTAIVLLLLTKLGMHLLDIDHPLARSHPLKIVGFALSISAGIDLAYMFFLPGVKEVIEPLILSISSAILLVLANQNIVGYDIAVMIVSLTASLAVLFWINYNNSKKI